MKCKLILLLCLGLFLFAGSSFAQDTAPPDTVILVITPPVASGLNFKLTGELYFFTTPQDVVSASMGFKWFEPNLTLDSAVASPLAVNAFNLSRFLYPNNNIDSANSQNRFVFGGARISGNGLLASNARKLIATYYFTLSPGPGLLPIIDFDTSTFSSGTIFKLVGNPGVTIVPQFNDPTPVGNPLGIIQTGDGINLPGKFALNQNYPNPFNPKTIISFDLPKGGDYTLTIYNVAGQAVEEINNSSLPGKVVYEWNATRYASGVYFYKVVSGEHTATKKMMLLK
ncbi:MAG: T9SS type A sorting domain-containing protein [candidate division Zixibacteria bacterium]|nr:T9SS type A sorting domain-containing protein [candidate division Zixibacteria bacterium]